MTFTDVATTEQRSVFFTATAELPAKIDGLESFRSGTDLGLAPATPDVAVDAEFTDANTWRVYVDAPTHVSFVGEHVTPLRASWCAIQCDPPELPDRSGSVACSPSRFRLPSCWSGPFRSEVD